MYFIHDVIIIGAGPSGLLAGYVLRNNHISYLIIEKGKVPQDREKTNEEDVASGVGGGGLFSDGKISFSPSGSWMWRNLNCDKLKKSYNILKTLLQECDINLPEFDLNWVNIKDANGSNYEKKYNSLIMSDFSQSFLLGYLYKINKEYLITKNSVISIEKSINCYFVTTDVGCVYRCKQIIFAAGKYGYSSIETIKNDNNLLENDKLEVGIRFECDSDFFKPYYSENTDYKFIDKINNSDEIRTFCCCKQGAIIKSKYNGWMSFNSTKDRTKMPENGKKSSIGVLIRSENPESVLYKEMWECIERREYSFNITAYDFFYSNHFFIGKNCDARIKELISNRLVKKGINLNTSFVFGPEIEYVGKYLRPNSDLKIDENFYIIGDASGLYRGLLPALISGIYSALEISSKQNKYIENSVERLGINISDSEPMELVFTAQSKNYFYCRDVICQFVLEQNKLPINPFRVFDYFLGDRVKRDTIRRGNNQLINTCKELWVFGPIADGVLFEIALAKINRKKIRFFTIGTVTNEIKEITNLTETHF